MVLGEYQKHFISTQNHYRQAMSTLLTVMEKRLKDLFLLMKVPQERRGTGIHNLIWLHRNLAKNYANHKYFSETKKIIQQLIRQKTSR